MGFGQVIKDVTLITSWLILIFIFSIFILFSQLLVVFIGGLIFIYEEIKGKRYDR
mgnify:CR=1 FL=1